MAFKLQSPFNLNDPDNKKEVRRENKQVRRLARLRRLEDKGKTDTKRYSKLKEKVYSPFNKKAKAKRDACYYKVKARYTRNGGTWPSAYGSGALSKCRKVGASNWGNKSKKK